MDHGSCGGLHYLDNASTTFPKPEAVLQNAAKLGAAVWVNPGRAAFDLAVQAETLVRQTRQKLARLFGGPDLRRVVFGYNATDALNLVIFGTLRSGGHVVSTRLEHNSVLRPIAHCVDDFGATATLVPPDAHGRVDPDDIRKSLRPETKLVVVNHGSNVTGAVQPVAEIGKICRAAEVIFCIDAAQTAGVIPIDMQAMCVDVVAFTGHKALLGPMGIGGLCIGPSVEIPHSRAGGTGVNSAQRRHPEEYPHRLEFGTPNMLGIAGLASGVDYIAQHGGVQGMHAREMSLARVLWEGLRSTRRLRLYCAASLAHRTPVFAFNIQGMDPAEVGTRLDVDHNVACRTGLHCAPLVHADLGTAPHGAVRFSLGPLTSAVDVQAALHAVRAIAGQRNGRSQNPQQNPQNPQNPQSPQ